MAIDRKGERRSSMAVCVEAAPVYGLDRSEALDIVHAQLDTINEAWDEVAEASGLRSPRNYLFGRQNPEPVDQLRPATCVLNHTTRPARRGFEVIGALPVAAVRGEHGGVAVQLGLADRFALPRPPRCRSCPQRCRSKGSRRSRRAAPRSVHTEHVTRSCLKLLDRFRFNHDRRCALRACCSPGSEAGDSVDDWSGRSDPLKYQFMAATLRQAACPSPVRVDGPGHRMIARRGRSATGRPLRRCCRYRSRRAVPLRRLPPRSFGHLAKDQDGTPSAGASSCTPPESVRTRVASASREVEGKEVLERPGDRDVAELAETTDEQRLDRGVWVRDDREVDIVVGCRQVAYGVSHLRHGLPPVLSPMAGHQHGPAMWSAWRGRQLGVG